MLFWVRFVKWIIIWLLIETPIDVFTFEKNYEDKILTIFYILSSILLEFFLSMLVKEIFRRATFKWVLIFFQLIFFYALIFDFQTLYKDKYNYVKKTKLIG